MKIVRGRCRDSDVAHRPHPPSRQAARRNNPDGHAQSAMAFWPYARARFGLAHLAGAVRAGALTDRLAVAQHYYNKEHNRNRVCSN